MKKKIKLFLILFPLLELIAFLLAFLIQILYEIKVYKMQLSVGERLLQMIQAPVQSFMQCIDAHNPFIIIFPVGILIFIIYVLSKKAKRHGEIDEESGIYGDANWETAYNLTKQNRRKRSKFIFRQERSIINSFLESINEK